MPIISALTLYPIKSCAGIPLQAAVVTQQGLSFSGVCDREWMVVNSDGFFLTQRECPTMALVRPQLEGKQLILEAPGVTSLVISIATATPASNSTLQVQVWEDILAANDCGDKAADWFSLVLGLPCRLVRFDPSVKRLANRTWTEGLEVSTHFADGFPILLISDASLEDLNQKLVNQGRAALSMNRFRPNIVIDGVAAFEEDYAQSLTIKDGNRHIFIKPTKPCSRCTIPSVDQATGIIGPDPMDLLQAYRANSVLDGAITFGMNAILIEGAGQEIRVGDTLELELAF